MWEITVCFNNLVFAKAFKDSVEKDIKSLSGIITILEDNDVSKVLVAVKYENKFIALKQIKTKLAENILTCYKRNYIMEKLNFNVTKNTNMQVFLKALVCFDSEIDKEIILNKLSDITNKIFIESFINFKLSFLKKKWNELVELANDNSIYLATEETFNEFIKFLISNLENRIGAVNIFRKENCYFLCDSQGKVIDDFLFDNSCIYDENNLLTNLIALNPEKIIVHASNNLRDNLIKNLYEYFSNRVEIYK